MPRTTLFLIPAAAVALGLVWFHTVGLPQAVAADPASAPAAAASGAAAPAGGAAGGRGGPQTVGVFAARRQDVPVQVEASGRVVTLDAVDLRSQVASVVREVLVKDGQMVRAGDVLFRLDDRAERVNLERARAQIARDQALLADLERQLKRAQELRAQNFIAASGVDTLQAQVDAQRALLQVDAASVQAAEVNLSYYTLKAPFAGRVGEVAVSPGALVQAAATAPALVNLSRVDTLGVSFALPEAQLQGLLQAQRGGRPLKVSLLPAGAREGRGASAAVPAAPGPAASGTTAGQPARGQASANGSGKPAGGLGGKPTAGPDGTVRFIDSAVDPSTGTVRVRADFDNRQQQLWPGQTVRVRVQLRTLADAVVVPQAALVIRGNDRAVYVVSPEKTAQLKPVQVRQPFGELVVVEGLEAGEKVIVDGRSNVRPGGAVREVPMQAEGGGKRGGGGGGAGGPGAGAASAAAGASGARP